MIIGATFSPAPGNRLQQADLMRPCSAGSAIIRRQRPAHGSRIGGCGRTGKGASTACRSAALGMLCRTEKVLTSTSSSRKRSGWTVRTRPTGKHLAEMQDCGKPRPMGRTNFAPHKTTGRNDADRNPDTSRDTARRAFGSTGRCLDAQAGGSCVPSVQVDALGRSECASSPRGSSPPSDTT